VTEYGDPTNATDFPYLLAESPLQNVAVPAGSGQYPAVMVTTGACPPDWTRRWLHAAASGCALPHRGTGAAAGQGWQQVDPYHMCTGACVPLRTDLLCW